MHSLETSAFGHGDHPIGCNTWFHPRVYIHTESPSSMAWQSRVSYTPRSLRLLPASMCPVVLWDMFSELWDEILEVWIYFSNSKQASARCTTLWVQLYNASKVARMCSRFEPKPSTLALPPHQISRCGEAGHGFCLLSSLLHLAAASLRLGQA